MKNLLETFLTVALCFAASSALASGPSDNCTWVDAGGWGQDIQCQSPNLAFGLCGSGENPDCPDGQTNQLYCCAEPNLGKSTRVKAPGFGERIHCPDNQVVVAFCGSGRNQDCAGGLVNSITCAPNSSIKLKPETHIWHGTKDFGGQVFCPKNMIMTGACGSGKNKDCPGGNVNEIRCTAYTITN